MSFESTTDSQIKEFKLVDLINGIWSKKRNPLGCTFEITPRCNLECVHCYLNCQKDMTNLSLEKVLEILDILHQNGVLFVTLTGGEIFTRKDFDKIYIYAKRKGFIISLFTNGTMINKEIISLLETYPPHLIDISIYGASEETYVKLTKRRGMYSRFLNTLNLLKNAKLRFALKAPICSINKHELKEMQEICKKYSDESLRFSFDIAPTREDNSEPLSLAIDPLEAVFLEIEDGSRNAANYVLANERNDWVDAKVGDFIPTHFCNIGLYEFHINHQGIMSPCIECTDFGSSLFLNEFSTIWNDFGKFKQQQANPQYLCSSCDFFNLCKSCPQVRRRMHGDANIVKSNDCINANIKYLYYSKNYSKQELESFYYTRKGGEKDV